MSPPKKTFCEGRKPGRVTFEAFHELTEGMNPAERIACFEGLDWEVKWAMNSNLLLESEARR